MSNEELAVMIQGGERDSLMELWQQIRRMALKEAIRWAAYHSNGVELEDPCAAQALEDAGERMQQERLHAALEAAVSTAASRFAIRHPGPVLSRRDR